MTAIVIDENVQVRIPAIGSLGAFRRWARSPQFPERGWFSYLDGELRVDLSMEQLVHNLIKLCFSTDLTMLARQQKTGTYLGDRMLLTNLVAGLSTEPDGMFVLNRSVERGRVRLKRGKRSLEVLGTPDMALEVISPTSVNKDMELLPRLYWLARIREYWRVDARLDAPQLEILRRGRAKYRTVQSNDGWVASAVFGKSFRLLTTNAKARMPGFTLEMK